ncbi:MAG: acyl-CoA thioesterase, partial [Marinovum sp.]|nr:acyl-CoA thioesterase [Marinovum sp.]
IYHAEAGYPDLIHAGLRVGDIGTSSWRYEVGLFRNDEPHAFAEGFFSQVQVDALTGKPTPLSTAYRDQLGQVIAPI